MIRRSRSSAPKRRMIALASLSLLLLLTACGGGENNYNNKHTNGSGDIGTNTAARFAGKIIFVKNRNIFLLNGKDNSLTQLTSGNNTLQPSLSPDGQTLAFEVRKPKTDYSDLATMPLSGGTPKMLTDNSPYLPPGVNASAESGARRKHYEFWAGNPIWTPDGEQIIFLTDFFKGAQMTPHFANPTCPGISEGPNADWILDMGIGEISSKSQPLPALKNPPKQLAWPYCAAGGDQDLSLRPGVSDTEILFTSFSYLPPKQELIAQISLLILSADGNNRLIQLSPPDPNAIPMEPSWSPDGKYITFIRRENNGQDNLYIMPVPDTNITGTPNNEVYFLESGGKDTCYTNTSYYQHAQKLAEGLYGNPIWGDMSHLVFMKFENGEFNLFLARLKFSGPAATPTGTPNPTATTSPASAPTISFDGAPIPLTKGGVDGESRPIWFQPRD